MLLCFFLFSPLAAAAPTETFPHQSSNTALVAKKAISPEIDPYRTIVREAGNPPISEIKAQIRQISREFGVPEAVVSNVIECESQFNPNAVGDQGRSFGLAQIFMPVWGREVSISEAKNPEFAISFMAKKIANGEGRLWTCYRKLYGQY